MSCYAGYLNVQQTCIGWRASSLNLTALAFYLAAPMALLPFLLAGPRPDLTSSSCSIPV